MCWHNSHKATTETAQFIFKEKSVMEAEYVSKLIKNIIPK
jgi:hypothetical protein